MLDSGAFSAYTRKEQIDIDEYIAFIKAHLGVCTSYVALDVIPGEFGRRSTAQEVEDSAQQSWDNLLYMESHGLRPIPVYHQGEDISWLHKMIKAGWDYIGISPANDVSPATRMFWLDGVFHQIVDAKGYAIIKTHGFGVTAAKLMLRYPWYTVDSTSWIQLAAYGVVIVPARGVNGWRYDRAPVSVFVSDQSPARSVEGKHFDSFSPAVQQQIREYFQEEGVTLEQLSADYEVRTKVNVQFYKRVCENKKDERFMLPHQQGFLE